MWDQMETERRVVVGIDGSEPALAAVGWAADYAAQRNLGLTLLTAEEPLSHGLLDLISPEPVDVMLEKEARTILNRATAVARSGRPDLDVQGRWVWNGPAPALISASKDAALLVMSNRGLGGWSGLLLGSVCADVAPRAHCPVVVIPSRLESAPRESGPILLGVQDTPEGRAAARFAFAHAQAWGEEVIAVLTWQIGRNWRAPLAIDAKVTESMRQSNSEQLEEVLADARTEFPDVAVRPDIAFSEPIAALAKGSQTARLVVVGNRGRGQVRGALLGSVSLGLIQASHCPVAVIRTEDSAELPEEPVG